MKELELQLLLSLDHSGEGRGELQKSTLGGRSFFRPSVQLEESQHQLCGEFDSLLPAWNNPRGKSTTAAEPFSGRISDVVDGGSQLACGRPCILEEINPNGKIILSNHYGDFLVLFELHI